MKKIHRSREEVIRLWVKALRSGKYKQGTGVLREGDRFCCLGVLCDLNRIDGGAEWETTFWMNHYYFYGGDDIRLPNKIKKFVGLSASKERSLAGLNDGGKSFREIADVIEKMTGVNG